MRPCPSRLQTDGTTPMHPPPNRPTSQPPAPSPSPPNSRSANLPFPPCALPRFCNLPSVVLQVPSQPLKHCVSAKVFPPFIYLIELRNAISHERNPSLLSAPRASLFILLFARPFRFRDTLWNDEISPRKIN